MEYTKSSKQYGLSPIGRKIIIGALSVALAFGIVRYGCRQKEDAYKEKPKTYWLKDENLEKKLDTTSDGNKDYEELVKAVESGLCVHPEYANRLIRESIKAIDKTNSNYDKETYLAMFEKMREKAEQKPELMDHFGPRAQAYQEKKFLDKYIGTTEETVRDICEKAKEAGQAIKESEITKCIIENLKKTRDKIAEYIIDP